MAMTEYVSVLLGTTPTIGSERATTGLAVIQGSERGMNPFIIPSHSTKGFMPH